VFPENIIMGFAVDTKAVTAAGWAQDRGNRELMEDGTVFIDSFGGRVSSVYFAVFDGHGGREVVEMVTTELHDFILKELRRTPQVPDALRCAFQNCDKELRKRDKCQGGATACACVLQQEKQSRKIYTAHLGDSRAVLSRSGKAARLTSLTDHVACDPVEKQRVINAGGTIVNDRVSGLLNITRSFGNFMLKTPELPNDIISIVPDITCIELSQSDSLVVVACDGIWDVMSDQEVVDIVHEGMEALRSLEGRIRQEGKSLAEILARYVIEEALERGANDNLSCVIILL